jgi:putative ABC transport system permease protein
VIPLTTAMRRVLNIPYVHAIFVQSRNSADLDRLERDVRNVLQQRVDSRSGTAEPFVIQNQAILLRTERGAAQAMNRLIAGVVVLALVLGSVGIMAVTLTSVRERTPEIGLRRALGARRRDIRLQFLLESAMLAAAGGAAGAVVGVGAAVVGAIFGPWELVVSWRVALAGFGCSTLLGVALGTLPAARAARLEPIAALRAE